MPYSIDTLLNKFQRGEISLSDLKKKLTGIEKLPFAQVDIDRQRRTGQAECVFGSKKSVSQMIAICSALHEQNQPILVTRVSATKAKEVCTALPILTHDSIGNTLSWMPSSAKSKSQARICVVCAGTSDLSVAQECITTLKVNGHIPATQTDIGVAGLHRLLNALPTLKQYDILIVIAGMEGALPSVIAGLIAQPIIAVPTSVGYGAHQNGMTTLHAMLSSCASGLSVVNIDNGYGAACAAIRILDRILISETKELP